MTLAITSNSGERDDIEWGKGGQKQNEQHLPKPNHGLAFKDINDSREYDLHPSQWMLYSGMVADTGELLKFNQVAPEVNHGVRQPKVMAVIINAMLGNPAGIDTKYEPTPSYNNDRLCMRMWDMVRD